MKDFDLKERVALITGGNRGIGFAIACGLGRAGAAIMIGGRDQEKSEAALEELSALGIEARTVRMDVTREADCDAAIEVTINDFGRLDVLVNNAGITVR